MLLGVNGLHPERGAFTRSPSLPPAKPGETVGGSPVVTAGPSPSADSGHVAPIAGAWSPFDSFRERISLPGAIRIRSLPGATAAYDESVIRSALLFALTENAELLIDTWALPLLIGGEVVVSDFSKFESVTEIHYNNEFKLYVAQERLVGSEEEIGTRLAEVIRKGILEGPQSRGQLSLDIRAADRLTPELTERIREASERLDHSASPLWDQVLARIDQAWARAALYARQVAWGVPLAENRSDLERIASALTGEREDPFFEVTAASPLFRSDAGDPAPRAVVLKEMETLPETVDLVQAVKDILKDGFLKSIYSITGDETEEGPPRPVARAKLFGIYRRFYQIARSLGEDEAGAARCCIQWMDRLMGRVRSDVGSYRFGEKEARRVLNVIVRGSFGESSLDSKDLESVIPIEDLAVRVYDDLTHRAPGLLAGCEQHLPKDIWIKVMEHMGRNAVMGRHLQALLQRFSFPYLVDLFETLQKGRHYRLAGEVFRAIVSSSERSEARRGFVEKVCAESRVDFLGTWVTEASSGTFVDQLTAIVGILGPEGRGRIDPFLHRAAQGVMLKGGPEAFEQWGRIVPAALASCGVEGIGSAATDAAPFGKERFWYFYQAERNTRHDLFDKILKTPEARFQEAIDIFNAQPEQTQAQVLFDLLSLDSQRHQFARVMEAIDRSWLRRLLPLMDEERYLPSFTKSLVLSNIPVDEVCSVFDEIDVGFCVQIFLGDGWFWGPMGTTREERLNAARKRTINRLGLDGLVAEYREHWENRVSPAKLFEKGVIGVGTFRTLVSLVDVEKQASIFASLSDERAVQVFTDGQALRLADYHCKTSAQSLKSESSPFSTVTVSPSVVRTAKLFPRTRNRILLFYTDYLDNVEIHPTRKGGAKGFELRHLLFAAQHIGAMEMEGCGEMALDRARVALLRWFAVIYGERREELLQTPLARSLGMRRDRLFVTLQPLEGKKHERLQAAAPFYQALVKLRGIIQPYDTQTAPRLTMQSSFFAFSSDFWPKGARIPESLSVVVGRRRLKIRLKPS